MTKFGLLRSFDIKDRWLRAGERASNGPVQLRRSHLLVNLTRVKEHEESRAESAAVTMADKMNLGVH